MDERMAVRLITALSACRKATHLYPAAHPRYREALDELADAARACLADGPFTLNVHLGRLYQGSLVLPGDAPGMRSFAETLEAHRVESLTVHPEIVEDEFVSLIEVLGMRATPTLDVAEELNRRGVSAVTISAIVDEEAEEAAERDRQREQDRALYNRLLGVLRSLTQRINQTGVPEVGDAGIIVEGILARLMEDSAAVLGLATMNGQSESNLFHSINVMIYSLTIGVALGIPEEGLTALGVAALLHDIGKVAFDASDAQQAEAATYLHPKIGAEVLSRLPEQDRTPMLVAYEHHMAHDGSGYPEREEGYVTHPYSRIVAIADRYDRLTSPEPDGRGLTPDLAVMQLLRDTLTRLDQTLTRLFVKQLGVFPVGCIVRLSDQTVGVVSAGRDDSLRPRVRVVYDADGLALETPRDVELAEQGLEIVETVDPTSLAMRVSDHL
ncbi:MAG: HD domain-containing protein [Anaerosomatales bacterium]|nr:HD domain-containing protein [Anaerosomatales bacterium]